MGTGLTKGGRDFLLLGDFNVMCAYCGRKRKASEMVRDNEYARNLYCCPEHADQRHPQDYARGVPEKMAAPFVQPPLVAFTSLNTDFPLGIAPSPIELLFSGLTLETEGGLNITTEGGVVLTTEPDYNAYAYAILPNWISLSSDPAGVYVTNIQWDWASGGAGILIALPNAIYTRLFSPTTPVSGVLRCTITNSLGAIGVATVNVST